MAWPPWKNRAPDQPIVRRTPPPPVKSPPAMDTPAPTVAARQEPPVLVHPGPPKLEPIPPAQEKTTLMISQPTQGLHLRLVLLDLGANITKLIVARGKTPEDVALAVGIDIQSIYQIMTGRETDVSIKVLSDISDFLGATFIPHMVLPDVPPPAV